MPDRAADVRTGPGSGRAKPGKSRLRILHVVKGLGPGGAERLLCSAAAVRDRDRFDYDVAYVLPWKNHVVPQLTRSGAAVHCLGTGEPAGRASCWTRGGQSGWTASFDLIATTWCMCTRQ